MTCDYSQPLVISNKTQQPGRLTPHANDGSGQVKAAISTPPSAPHLQGSSHWGARCTWGQSWPRATEILILGLWLALTSAKGSPSISAICFLADLPSRSGYFLHLNYSCTSVSLTAQPLHITRAPSPTKHFSAPNPGQSQPRQHWHVGGGAFLGKSKHSLH